MKISLRDAALAAKEVLVAGHVPYFRGAPGVGKTQIFGKIAQDLGVAPENFKTLIASHYQPTQLQIPVFTGEDRATFRMSTSQEIFPTQPNSFFFMDEVGDASVAQQNMICNIVLDKRFGTWRETPNSFMALASNTSAHRSGSGRTITKLNNRVVIFDVSEDPIDLVDGVLSYGVDHGWPAWMLAAIKMDNSLCFGFDPGLEGAQLTPRSLDMVAHMTRGGVTPNTHAIVAGCIGDGHASKLLAIRRVIDNGGAPTIEEIIADPMNARTPKREEVVYSVVYGMARSKYHGVNEMAAMAKYAQRLDSQYAVMLILLWKESPRHKESLIATPDFITWLYDPKNATVRSMFMDV